MQTRNIRREELHTLVWTMPMAQAANELGVTRTELEVLCTRLDVPYPFSGYWNGPASAQRQPPRLRPAKPGTPDAMEIVAATPEPRRSAKKSAPAAEGDRRAKTPDAEPSATAPDAESRAAPVVPSRVTTPHRIIAARMEEERRRRASWDRLGVGQNTREGQVERRRRIVENLLYKAIEKKGHKVETERGSLYGVRFIVKGQTITYAIRERYTQKRRPLSPEELKDPFNVIDGRTHTQERLMTGQLILAADARYAAKAEWRDKPELPLELQIADIVEGVEELADRAAEQAARRAEQEQVWREEQARREEQRRLAQQEANRWRRVRELAVRHEQAQRVRVMLAELKRELAQVADADPNLAGWLEWAEARATAWDPVGRGLKAVVDEVQAVTAYDYPNDGHG